MCLQGLLSLINLDAKKDDGIKGMEAPGQRGEATGTTTALLSVFADDMGICLRDENQLPKFRELLGVYEEGSDARNSWDKTFALRTGKLRGRNTLPAGWQEGRDINCDPQSLRYLGTYEGNPDACAKKMGE